MQDMTKEEKKRFAPLQKYEDRQKAIWFFYGGMTVIVLYLIVNYLF